jgi:hypothetical protein
VSTVVGEMSEPPHRYESPFACSSISRAIQGELVIGVGACGPQA